ncbi:MAG: hypothetical protein ACRDYX_12265 [Egibacteraceae bacterium]
MARIRHACVTNPGHKGEHRPNDNVISTRVPSDERSTGVPRPRPADLFEPLGNLSHEPVTAIWARYRFKHNHFAKHLGASIRTLSRSAPVAPGGGGA